MADIPYLLRGVMPVAGSYTSTKTSSYLGLNVAVQIKKIASI